MFSQKAMEPRRREQWRRGFLQTVYLPLSKIYLPLSDFYMAMLFLFTR